MSPIKQRILQIAYKNKLCHLGSYLSSVEIIDNIYSKINEDDIFILSSGHAALALYVCLEKYYGIDAEYLFAKHGGHPVLDEDNKIFCSTGSLGLGIAYGLGRAIGSPNKQVHILISDGECSEGSVWETLALIVKFELKNIHIHVNVNGYSAYDEIDTGYLIRRLKSFLPDINLHFTDVNQTDFLNGLNAHYHIMTEEDYKSINS